MDLVFQCDWLCYQIPLILKTIKSTVSDLLLYLFPKPGFAVTHTPAKSSKDSLLLFLSSVPAKAPVFLFKILFLLPIPSCDQ